MWHSGVTGIHLLGNSFYILVHLLQVYHTFHDEVAEYRQHWWRCNGPCQSRKPYFGYVKRAMNRAPGPRDPWFRDHQNSCNGTFIKVKEPENYGKKKKKGEGKSEKTSSKAGTNMSFHYIPHVHWDNISVWGMKYLLVLSCSMWINVPDLFFLTLNLYYFLFK